MFFCFKVSFCNFHFIFATTLSLCFAILLSLLFQTYFQIGHDGVTPGSGWYVKEVEVDMPTKGKHYFFSCKSWLARDKGDGKTSRVFSIRDEDTTTMLSYKPCKSGCLLFGMNPLLHVVNSLINFCSPPIYFHSYHA